MSPTVAQPVHAAQDISLPAKLLFNTIVGLSSKKSHCWASQAFLAERIGRSQRMLRRYIAELVTAGLLCVERGTKSRTNRYYPQVGQNMRTPVTGSQVTHVLLTGYPCPVDRSPVTGSPVTGDLQDKNLSINTDLSSSSTAATQAPPAAAKLRILPNAQSEPGAKTALAADAAFKALGIDSGAVRELCGQNPAHAADAAAWLKRELGKRGKKIRDLVAFALGVLRTPAKFGWEKVGERWLPPDRDAIAAQAVAQDRKLRDRQQAQAHKQAEAAAQAWWRNWRARWDSLEPEGRERIQAQAKRDFPLLARASRDSYFLLATCLRILEAEDLAPG